MRVTIPGDLLAAILAEAAETPGREVCGLLFGSDARIDAIEPCANVAADAARTFELDPRRLLAAHRAERGGGPRIVGHYHSHPSGSAEPSAADLAASTPGQLWLIVGGGVGRLWLAREGGFDEARLLRG